MRQSKADKSFRVNFRSTNNMYSNVSLNKTVNTFKPKAEINTTDKDIYYDEVIYYDGGDVNGYGDNK